VPRHLRDDANNERTLQHENRCRRHWGRAVGAAVAYFVKLLDPSTAVSVIERDPAYSQASTPQSSILAGR
jgi:hypothetical protein